MEIPETLIDPTKDYYAILGIPPNAPFDEIRKAHKRAAIKYHPDKGGDAKKFQEAQEAWEVLKDGSSRRYYKRIREEFMQPGSWSYRPGGRGGTEDPFENIRRVKLSTFIFNSFKIFQERLGIWIPPDIYNHFQDGVKFVYETWNAIKTQEPENIDVVCTRFGAFQLQRRNQAPAQRQLTDGRQ